MTDISESCVEEDNSSEAPEESEGIFDLIDKLEDIVDKRWVR
jgi:hypothetical protein